MPGPSGNSTEQRGRPLRVLQFTDTHFFGTLDGRLMGVDTASTFKQVVKLAHEQHGAPDFYLLTGDLSQDETEQSYQRFAESAKELLGPAYYLPGNHDIRPLMEKAFAAHGMPFHADTDFVCGDWQIVLLDTQVQGEVHGHLSEVELHRLDAALSKHPDKHALVALHHHPVPIGSNWIDQIKVDNGDNFLSVIDKHPQVRAVLCGHIHQEFEKTRRDVLYLGTPSTCVQFKPRTEGFAIDAIPPGYRWLKLNPNGTVDSAVVRVQSVAAGLDMASLGY